MNPPLNPPVVCPLCLHSIPHAEENLSGEIGCPNCYEVFTVSMIEAPVAEIEEDGAPNPQAEARTESAGPVDAPPAAGSSRRRERHPVLTTVAVLMTLATCGLSFFAWQTEARLRELEDTVTRTRDAASVPMLLGLEKKLENLQIASGIDRELLEAVESALEQVSGDTKAHGSAIVQGHDAVRTVMKSALRQEERYGRLAAQLAVLENTVCNRSNDEKAAAALREKRRVEVEAAAKPIRWRISELEDKKNALLKRHQAVSVSRPHGGRVSPTKSIAMMEQWQHKIAPVLDQIQEEIERIRKEIDGEQKKIDDLYDSLTGSSDGSTP